MTDEQRLIESLKGGDERAFAWLVDEYSSALLRVAMTHVGTRAVAEEVVQETWLGVINGIDRFEGRSLVEDLDLPDPHEHRQHPRPARAPYGAVLRAGPGRRREGPVDADRFFAPDHARYPNHWALGPSAWETPRGRAAVG